MITVRARSDGGSAAAVPLLQIRDLETHIATRRGVVEAVAGVSLELYAGETLGLVGESGCGKTMTAMSVPQLLPRGAQIVVGEIILNGTNLVGLSANAVRRVRGNEIGVVFQNPMTALNPRLSVGAQLRESLPPEVRKRRDGAQRRSIELLSLVGIPRAAERLLDYPHELSGGLSQRVMIAMALAREPSLLIADEPTTALDVSIQAQILDLLSDLQRELHLGVLLVTHDMSVVAERAQRLAVMYAGRIVEAGPAGEVFARPRHRYTEALLDAVPRVAEGRIQPLRAIEGTPPDLVGLAVGCRFSPRCERATEHCRGADPVTVSLPSGVSFSCFVPHQYDEGPESRGADAPTRASFEFAPEALAQSAEIDDAIDDGGDVLVSVSSVEKSFPIATHGSGFGKRNRRGVSAVAGVSFSLKRGETLGIVGESGCGKTTLARLLVGLEVPDQGTVSFRGRDISDLNRRELLAWRRDVQLILQDPYSSLDPRMTVEGLVAEPLQIHFGGGAKQYRGKVADLLAEVGLPAEVAGQRPGMLSGGQRQRVGIARALALDPKVIVADEPVSALDVSVQATILNLLRRLRDERGLSYIVISHDLAVISYLCDRVAVMYLGKVVETGDVGSVFDDPTHPYTHGLLASVPGSVTRATSGLTGELPSPIDPPSGCRFRTRCPLAEERCVTDEPLLEEHLPGRRAACHFPLTTAGVALSH